MTESFRGEGSSPEHERLLKGEVEVYFDDPTTVPVVLEAATPRIKRFKTPYGLYEYDELHLTDGTTLTPADLSRVGQITDFTEGLVPYAQFGSSALLRTLAFREEIKFLDVIRMISSGQERSAVRLQISNEERMRVPGILDAQRDLFDSDMDRDFWIRLEATHDPDKSLVGKIIMARIAYFMASANPVGVMPIIYSIHDDDVYSIPEQLTINENWLYLNADY